MTGSDIGKLLLLPFSDAIAVGSVIGALNLFTTPRSNRLDAYEDAQIFLTVAVPAALAVFVVECVLHLIARALARRSGARGRLDVAPVGQATRGQSIGRLLLLPLLDATVLRLIVGVLFISIHVDHNPMAVIHDSTRAGLILLT